LTYSEEGLEIRDMPDGVYEFTDYLDDDGFEDKLVPFILKLLF
jgi:hypothetical protein